MGIPSYFAHVVRRHRTIMKKREAFGRPIDNFYMDCNSLIYDAVRDMRSNGEGKGASDAGVSTARLIAAVCAKIRAKVACARPRMRLIIAFDGVAPVAKLEQQRSRRYKSWFQKRVTELVDLKSPGWDTAAITPGTKFMSELGHIVRKEFGSGMPIEVIVSPPDVPGEGEHKIYQYIREHPEEHKDTCTVIYGLDADLIMLTLNHLSIAPDMHLYREAPEFARSLDASLDPDSAYLLNIPAFGEALSLDLRPQKKGAMKESRGMAVPDYIFLCFLLGNDFLPHFPALNIRTRGIDRLMAAYTAVVAPTRRTLVEGDVVVWPVVRKLMSFLADKETEFILEEYEIREKQARRTRGPQRTVDDELNAIPLRNRVMEAYIAPQADGWQQRYYRSLLGIEPDEPRIREVCLNYLQGLEWTLRYYTTGCPDWRWAYRYDYPPLLTDLVRYIPGLGTRLLEYSPPAPVHNLVQLAYVLPAPSLGLLPPGLKHLLMLRHHRWYEPDCEMRTAFCKYLWEAHPQLAPIDLPTLENLVGEWTRTGGPSLIQA